MAMRICHDGNIFPLMILKPFPLRCYDRYLSDTSALFQRFPSLIDLGRGAGAAMLRKQGEMIDTYLYLQTKYRELQEQHMQLRQHYVLKAQERFAHLRQLYLLIECAWCQRRIRWQRKESPVPGETSHGVCPPLRDAPPHADPRYGTGR